MRISGLALVAAAFAASIAAADAQTQDFYKGKTITIMIPYPPGGSYDRYARIAAEFMPKYIPGNPTIVTQYVPGGGGRQAANHVYRAAADGLARRRPRRLGMPRSPQPLRVVGRAVEVSARLEQFVPAPGRGLGRAAVLLRARR